jgi:hypothetical protein
MKEEITQFLNEKVFDPVLNSSKASELLKKKIRWTRSLLNPLPARSMIHFFWSAVGNPANHEGVYLLMKKEGFNSFEDVLPEFRTRFPLVD